MRALSRQAENAPWIAVATIYDVESDEVAAMALSLLPTCFTSTEAASGVWMWLLDFLITSMNWLTAGTSDGVTMRPLQLYFRLSEYLLSVRLALRWYALINEHISTFLAYGH